MCRTINRGEHSILSRLKEQSKYLTETYLAVCNYATLVHFLVPVSFSICHFHFSHLIKVALNDLVYLLLFFQPCIITFYPLTNHTDGVSSFIVLMSVSSPHQCRTSGHSIFLCVVCAHTLSSASPL